MNVAVLVWLGNHVQLKSGEALEMLACLCAALDLYQ